MRDGHVRTSQSEASKYEVAYIGTRQLMAPCCLAELQNALLRLAPLAREEAAWGVVDALADLVLEDL